MLVTVAPPPPFCCRALPSRFHLQLVSVDVNKVAQVPQQHKIKDLPTIKFFAEGKEVGSYVATDRGEVFYQKMEHHLRSAIGEDV